jgi:G patch domain/KOW motif-containing protein
LNLQEAKVLPVGPDGKVRHVRKLDEQLVSVAHQEFQPSQAVFIAEGLHAGLYATIVVVGDDKKDFVVRLRDSDRELSLPKSALLRTSEQAKIQERLREIHGSQQGSNGNGTATASSSSSFSSSSSSQRDSESKKRKDDTAISDSSSSSKKLKSSSTTTTTSASSTQRPWLSPHLVVRVVSKTFRNGEFYLQKAQVVDVVSPTECTIRLLDKPKLGVLDGQRRKSNSNSRRQKELIPFLYIQLK